MVVAAGVHRCSQVRIGEQVSVYRGVQVCISVYWFTQEHTDAHRCVKVCTGVYR